MNRRTFALAALSAGLSTGAPAEAFTDDALAQLEADPTQDPFSWIRPIHTLWSRGDKLQAAFWYYVWQIRSGPWAQADRTGSSAAALRASVTATLGRDINDWIAADPMVWRDTALRAISYEKKLPLFEGRPDQIDAEAWNAINVRRRLEYEAGFNQFLGGADDAAIIRRRQDAGLPAGPLLDTGKPLPEHWR